MLSRPRHARGTKLSPLKGRRVVRSVVGVLGVAWSVACSFGFTTPSTAAPLQQIAIAHSAVRSPPASGPSAIAQARGTMVALYQSPASPKPCAVLDSPGSSGEPLVFLVSELALAAYWVRVYLPSRPNGSQAWIRRSSVQLFSDNYPVQVQFSSHRLTVFDAGRAIIIAPVGVGRSVLPTPTGTYYIVDLLRQPDPNGEYGPFAFGLSAFSDVLQSFGGGPGEIGLHGTNDPSSVGANVSHGCLRVTNAMITELAGLLPLGTPVMITG
jgi:lipoprotein-anchoring transpeptidase ErfK/SrfK